MGSRTTAPLAGDEWQRRKDRYRLEAERAAARDIRVWPYDLIRLLDEAARCVRAEEALRQAERLITEHHKVGAFEGYHIGDTCPVCAAFGTPLAAVPVEDKPA